MGLIHLLHPIKTLLFLVLLCSLGLGACIKDIDFDDIEEVTYLFLDGGVQVNSPVQIITLGRTTGTGKLQYIPVTGANVVLSQPDAGEQVVCEDLLSGEYRCPMAGRYRTAYDLVIRLADGSTYTASTEALSSGVGRVTARAEVGQQRTTTGELVENKYAVAKLELRVPEEARTSVLLSRTGLAWSYTDQFCGGLDSYSTCYFEEKPEGAFNIIDLSDRVPGSDLSIVVGKAFADYRLGAASALSVELTRVPAEARTYYRDLGVALTQSGNIFSERPYSSVGNVVGEPGATPMLGYFTVRERQILGVSLIGDDIRAIADAALCVPGDNRRVPGFDCCYCSQSLGSMSRPPSWWPL